MGGPRSVKIIIGASTFNESKCGGNPDTSNELKKILLQIQPLEIHQAQSSKTCTTHTHQVTALLRVRVVLFSGANMQVLTVTHCTGKKP